MVGNKKAEAGSVPVRLSMNAVKKIDNAAKRFGGSRNQIASEIVEIYFEFWEEAEKQKQEAIAKQRATLKSDPGRQQEAR